MPFRLVECLEKPIWEGEGNSTDQVTIMKLEIGAKLPDATFLAMGPDGAGPVALSDLSRGNRIVMFGLPGAFTGTCTASHVPSFIRTAAAFREKGYAHIICFAVNDPFVMDAWAKSTGGAKAGITFLADADGAFTKAIGMNFDAPLVGFHSRTTRHAMLVDDGIVTAVRFEESRGVCDLTGGETLLDLA